MTVFTPDHEHARAFRDALGSFATGVTIVTITGPDGAAGMTVNSFTSVSLVPPLILWSPGKFSNRHDLFARAAHFSVHVLREEQRPIADHFARTGVDFTGIAHQPTPEGVPAIPDVLTRFDCAREAAHDAGDHTLVVGRVLRVEAGQGRPLVFAQGQWGGHRVD
ncbi:flavin reductase family protein [Paracoccus sp. SCSIO 75233]|uniref:flavin reductase family protein n=1 Tax=Paracoccus sp. SCSIO 75233 TaxID=3017782 RepID=UPI0022F02139|nr:flavin reductase family protein [Paracoccus sp. SCSIO 75233]WBU54671.1 flavin reductase family protein [Paracoccus sp. SCSIO 75233]